MSQLRLLLTAAQGIADRHPLISAALLFAAFELPQAIDAWLNHLARLRTEGAGQQVLPMPSTSLVSDFAGLIPSLIGLMLIFLIWRRNRGADANPNNSTARRWPAWLDDVADQDQRNLGSRIKALEALWDPSGLSTTEPYMDFNFTFFNGTVFKVFLTLEIHGNIRWQHTEFNTPELRGTRSGVEHGQLLSFVVRQRVQPGTRDELFKLKGEPIPFTLGGLAIYVGAENDRSDIRVALELPNQHFVWP